ncbi:MAG: hypothetical protein B7X06_04040, partial [Verrucomicrobia bacterium 21-51-4]
VCDPGKSSVCKKTLELMVQAEIARIRIAHPDDSEAQACREGWQSALKVMQGVFANARYITENSMKPILDVANGSCAMGLTVDYFALGEAEMVEKRSHQARIGFIAPQLGYTVEANSIAKLRGAPNPKLAEAFIEYTMSLEGQALWGLKADTPGGPKRYTLHRMPIRRDFYSDPKYLAYRSDPTQNPYAEGTPHNAIGYHPAWTAGIFGPLHRIAQCVFIDPQPELAEAWAAILEARQQGRMHDAQAALTHMQQFPGLDYDSIQGPLAHFLKTGSRQAIFAWQCTLTEQFIKQYRHSTALARGH